VHAVVNQKHTGYLVALVTYAVIVFASKLGLDDHLLIYGSGPRWSYSDMRGFGPSLGPWLWFKVYWTAWALLLAVAARVLWVRGTEPGLRLRLQVARRRFAGTTAGVAAAGVTLVVSVGGFIFYNTNVLNAYETSAGRMERAAEYERRYGKYAGVAQPTPTSTNLRVEIYPERREVGIRGTYVLANISSAAIDSIHVASAPEVETGTISVDRPAATVVADDDFGYRVYALKTPLQPGDSLHLSFEVHVEPRGFRNDGVNTSVVANGTYFTNQDWLPAIGYQRRRELTGAGERRQHGLAPRREVRSLDDVEARRISVAGDRVAFEAVVGTSANQIAVAPGVLRRTWTEGERRYFQYVADAPINNQYAIFSANYAVHEEQWSPSTGSGPTVAIQVYHHPGHAAIRDRIVAGARASLDDYTQRFGAYPYSYLRFIENPARGGTHAEAATIEYGERFTLMHPSDRPGDLDLVFAVVALSVAGEWWGLQVAPADVEGSGLLIESLETYSAMHVVEKALGPERLRRWLFFMREDSMNRPRAGPPLLRATDSLAFTRRGPFALYAMREYIGKERVDEALRRLFEKHRSATPPLATSGDLYQELQAVTPDAFKYLLHDLFEQNTFWEVETERATAQPTEAGAWQVTLGVRARKVVVDEAGVETEVPMDDWMEVGAFHEDEPFLQTLRIRPGRQTITVTVAKEPTSAGIDPRYLLDELDEANNNVKQLDLSSRRLP
jgi:hypothetical protein